MGFTQVSYNYYMQMDIVSWFLIVVMLMVLAFVLMKLYRLYRLQHYEVRAPDIDRGHRWYMIDIFPEQTYCTIGHYRIKHGATCDSCGVCVDDHNMKTADKQIHCKPVSEIGNRTLHHWVQGNLPLYSKCFICGEDCGVLPQICDVWCAWCRRTAHEDCKQLCDLCDLGRFKTAIVPPNCVRLKQVGIKGRRRLVVSSASHPDIPNWSPLIVVATRKSGNNEGEFILRAFRGFLHPSQVIDLNDVPPENGLEWCHLLPDVTFRVLVCGGDGTIGWVLNAIDNLKLKNPPNVCILPLGTGNDMSRVLGWGEGYTHGDVNIPDILEKINEAEPSSIDRWKVEISMRSIVMKKKQVVMNNYASIGVDALVTLNFHRQRESRPWLFAHRLINKLCYFTYGTKDVMERECKHLNKKITVELDGRLVSLPDIEGLVVLNIASWGGGCLPWTLDDGHQQFQPARYDDGLLEVMALYSSFHIAQLQVGMAGPIRVGQARTVKITLHGGKVPMQVDGEPWEQRYPAEIFISHQGQAKVMASDT